MIELPIVAVFIIAAVLTAGAFYFIKRIVDLYGP